METRLRVEATNNTSPIGGVASPTVRLTHITMAKCNGSIPSDCIVGASNGPSIRMAGPASKNIPTTNNKRFTQNNTISGFSLTAVNRPVTAFGTPDRDVTHPNTVAAPITSRMLADA